MVKSGYLVLFPLLDTKLQTDEKGLAVYPKPIIFRKRGPLLEDPKDQSRLGLMLVFS